MRLAYLSRCQIPRYCIFKSAYGILNYDWCVTCVCQHVPQQHDNEHDFGKKEKHLGNHKRIEKIVFVLYFVKLLRQGPKQGVYFSFTLMEDSLQWRISLDVWQPLIEDSLRSKPTFDWRRLRWKTTFNGRSPLVKDNLGGRKSSMEDNLQGRTASDGRLPLMEDTFYWRWTSMKDDF